MWLAIVHDTRNGGVAPRKRWLRPGRTYQVGGRPTKPAADIPLFLANLHSRVVLQLSLSGCSVANAEDTGDEDAKCYALEVENLNAAKAKDGQPGKVTPKMTYTLKRLADEGGVEFGPGAKADIRTGDRLVVTEEVVIEFVYHNVVVHIGSLKNEALHNHAASLASLGIRWASKFGTPQDRAERSYQTHLFLPKFVNTMAVSWFAQNQRFIVGSTWIDALIETATFNLEALGEVPTVAADGSTDPRVVSKDPAVIEWRSRAQSSDDRWQGISDLEADFDKSWPYEAEQRYFPPAGDQTYGIEAHQWAPNEARHKVFQDSFIVMLRDYRSRELVDELVRLGAGGFLYYDLINHTEKTASACTAEIEAHQVAANKDLVSDRKIVLLKIVSPKDADVAVEAKLEKLADGIARRLQIAHYKSYPDIQHAVYMVDASGLNDTDRGGIRDSHPVGRATEPAVVATAATVEPTASKKSQRRSQGSTAAAVPSTADQGPSPGSSGAARVLAPESLADPTPPRVGPAPAPSNSQDEMPPPPVKRKLTRRAKTRNDEDMLDDILGFSATGPSSSLAGASSYAAEGGSAPMDIDAGGSYDAPAPSTSRSRLKRRLGTNATPSDDPSQAFSVSDTPRQSRRGRSRSAEVEDSSLGVSLPQRKRPLGTISEFTQVSGMDDDLDFTPAAKRKAAAALAAESMGLDTPDPSRSARKRPRRHSHSDEEAQGQATPEAPSTAKGKKSQKEGAQDDDDEEEAARKFLAIKTGRKKVTESEREFNDEFNRLRLAKPELLKPPKVEAHKIKWNERDLNEEERKEMDDWTKLESGQSCFVVRFVNFERKAKRPPVVDQSADPRWAGMPNFKRFRPKNATGAAPHFRRPEVRLELEDADDFGVNYSNKGRSKGRIALAVVDSQSQSQSQAAPSTARSANGKGKAKSGASRARSQTLEFSEDSDSDAAVDSRLTGKTVKKSTTRPTPKSRTQPSQTQAKKASASAFDSPPPKTVRRGREVITLEDSDSDGGVFGGLDASPVKGTKRKR